MKHFEKEGYNSCNNIYTFYSKTVYFGSFDGAVRARPINPR